MNNADNLSARLRRSSKQICETGHGRQWSVRFGQSGHSGLRIVEVQNVCEIVYVAAGITWGEVRKVPPPLNQFQNRGVVEDKRVDAIVVGLALDFAGFNAVKMLFWSAILNGLLAPPLVVMVVLLTNDRKVMRSRVNSLGMRMLRWICAIVMSAAACALLAFLR